jgi:hypothetical protein
VSFLVVLWRHSAWHRSSARQGLLKKECLFYLGGLLRLRANQTIERISRELNGKIKELKRSRALHKAELTGLTVGDTVSSLGIPTRLQARPLSFVWEHVPKRVRYAFHALALERPVFKPVSQSRINLEFRGRKCQSQSESASVGSLKAIAILVTAMTPPLSGDALVNDWKAGSTRRVFQR